ncbi:MAG: transposase [Verrucomicrobiota bacterium]
MPRQPRIQFPGALYHLVNRGDRDEAIVHTDEDRQRFLETLGEACAKTGWIVHAFCLLPDEFQLVVETPQPNLVDGMKWFLGTYTIQFNRRHRIKGHLFSGRYRSLVIDAVGDYLRRVCDYVHLAPVRAGLVMEREPLCTFAWSSLAQCLQSPEQRVPWFPAARLFQQAGLSDDAAGRAAFEKTIEQRRETFRAEEWNHIRRGWCFGSAEFRYHLLKLAQNPEAGFTVPRKEAGPVKAEEMLAQQLAALGWTEQDLKTRAKGDPVKISLARRLREETTVSLKWVANRLRLGTWTYLANNLYAEIDLKPKPPPRKRGRKPKPKPSPESPVTPKPKRALASPPAVIPEPTESSPFGVPDPSGSDPAPKVEIPTPAPAPEPAPEATNTGPEELPVYCL